jgi:phenylpyruvate tautomerase PptA (4-oxalocrotonate tautomerase family)
VPIIIVKTIKNAVLTSDEQKRELLKKMTDTFIEVVGEVARPFTYCIIEETPMYEWALAGVPLPDYKYLTSPEWKGLQSNSEKIMTDYMAYLASQAGGDGSSGTSEEEKRRKAEDVFGS